MSITIHFPSPTTFLSSEVAPSPKPAPLTTTKTRKTAFFKTSTAKKNTGDIPTKPKQSKSRNGCVTCKKKRLKCDETKPSCRQCHKRSVPCEGYKKIFQWKSFGETTTAAKLAPHKPKRDSPASVKTPDPVSNKIPAAANSHVLEIKPDFQDNEVYDGVRTPPPASIPPELQIDTEMSGMVTPLREVRLLEPDTVTSSLDSMFEDDRPPICTGMSPKLTEIAWPAPEFDETSAFSGDVADPNFLLTPLSENSFPVATFDDDVEEIIRESESPGEDLWMSYTGPVAAPFDPDGYSSFGYLFYPQSRFLDLQGVTEMLICRYDNQTCGILSIKNGANENPWRTSILPMTDDCPALYHAIASMTAFHISREDPSFRVVGADHMGKATWLLRHRIEEMNTETALAIVMALAFSESWDQHISTGGVHLRAARFLIQRALYEQDVCSFSAVQIARRKFLLNTWVYMDVIARLTSFDDDDQSTDFDSALTPSLPFGPNKTIEVDPLMGCASTLFPLIGRAANLCRRILSNSTNIVSIVNSAVKLKEQIEQWTPGTPSDFSPPEDKSSEVHDAIQTAEAYRYATLLYLHQMVPEIPSLTSAQLAKKALMYLTTVSSKSRLVIIHIFPLLAAGCEAIGEDRKVVAERWQAMSERMWIGNVDKCYEVTREVWSRRDAEDAIRSMMNLSDQHGGEEGKHEDMAMLSPDGGASFGLGYFQDFLMGGNGRCSPNQHMPRQPFAPPPPTGQAYCSPPPTVPSTPVVSSSSRSNSSTRNNVQRARQQTENLDPECTVRGQMHWVGVMREWNWEVLLG